MPLQCRRGRYVLHRGQWYKVLWFGRVRGANVDRAKVKSLASDYPDVTRWLDAAEVEAVKSRNPKPMTTPASELDRECDRRIARDE